MKMCLIESVVKKSRHKNSHLLFFPTRTTPSVCIEEMTEKERQLSNKKNQQCILAFFVPLSLSPSSSFFLCQHSFALHESVSACFSVFFSLTRTQCDLHTT